MNDEHAAPHPMMTSCDDVFLDHHRAPIKRVPVRPCPLSKDLEDLVAWLARRTDKTSICRLLRVSWETVQAVVMRVVAEHLDDSRLDLLLIGGWKASAFHPHGRREG